MERHLLEIVSAFFALVLLIKKCLKIELIIIYKIDRIQSEKLKEVYNNEFKRKCYQKS